VEARSVETGSTGTSQAQAGQGVSAQLRDQTQLRGRPHDERRHGLGPLEPSAAFAGPFSGGHPIYLAVVLALGCARLPCISPAVGSIGCSLRRADRVDVLNLNSTGCDALCTARTQRGRQRRDGRVPQHEPRVLRHVRGAPHHPAGVPCVSHSTTLPVVETPPSS
jgi:hypothetical protein